MSSSMLIKPLTIQCKVVSGLFTLMYRLRFFFNGLLRNLREARDNAVLEKGQAVEAERDVQSRYDHLLEQ